MQNITRGLQLGIIVVNYFANVCVVIFFSIVVHSSVPSPLGQYYEKKFNYYFVVELTCYSMQTKSVKDEYLDMIKHGHLNIIVGTHSLLGNRVVYNNLGLLVVDEEQVFFLASILSSV